MKVISGNAAPGLFLGKTVGTAAKNHVALAFDLTEEMLRYRDSFMK
jgi:hypothetical protein